MRRRRVEFETTQQVMQALQALVDTGLYGRDCGEAAERIVARHIAQECGPQGLLDWIPPKPKAPE